MYIDTHTHLFDQAFQEDRAEVIQQAIAANVQQFILPNIDEDTMQHTIDLATSYPNHCYAALGLHPCSVTDDVHKQLDTVYAFIQKHKESCYAIGETGLDYYWDKTYLEQQKIALQMQATWAKELDLPIILHTRDSFSHNVELMSQEQDGTLKGIFHCFSGSVEQAKQVIDLGFLLGIGGVITFKNGGKELRETLKQVPLSSIVLETDSPYLAPHPHRGKRNQSSYLPLVANVVAEVKEVSIEEVAMTTTNNARHLFGIG